MAFYPAEYTAASLDAGDRLYCTGIHTLSMRQAGRDVAGKGRAPWMIKF